MYNSYVLSSSLGFSPEPEDNVMDSIFRQYESVIVESIITSFGLDFLVHDHHGGDVETIHNVRQVGEDDQMTYKNKANLDAYNNRGEYNSHNYHSDKCYIEINREISRKKDAGILTDSYTGDNIGHGEKSDLDHVISAKEIHDDAGRVLSGLSGIELANSDENLLATNPHTNRTKKANSMDKFIDKYGNEYTEEQKANMRKKDAKSREYYESRLAKAYYTGPQFAKDVAVATGKVSVNMGLRQALGFVFTEVWFAVKEEFNKVKDNFELSKLFTAIGNGIKRGFTNAKEKYKELLAKFQEGVIAGALSSLTTTLCNIFFTTAKNVVKIIRQTYASIVQAAKVLFINPDNLPFGERMRAVVKIIATGASVVLGGIVSEALGKTPIGVMPVIGDIIQTFCGTLVTGMVSCTLLYFLDRSEIMNELVHVLNYLSVFSIEVDYFRQQAAYFETYAAELMQIDLAKFHEETAVYNSLSHEIENAKSETELNTILKNAMNKIGIKIPWVGDFNCFMSDKSVTLVFE